MAVKVEDLKVGDMIVVTSNDITSVGYSLNKEYAVQTTSTFNNSLYIDTFSDLGVRHSWGPDFIECFIKVNEEPVFNNYFE